MNKLAVILPSGPVVAFPVTAPSHMSHHRLKSSVFMNRFVLAHSQRKPLSVLGEIGSQARVVLKYLTQSTFAPWNGAVVSTFVETYPPNEVSLCPVTSSICISQT